MNYSGSYDWEDGGTILGSYGNLGSALNVFDPLGSGHGNVLEIHEDPLGGTPQAFVAWITGLTDGDEITGSFWALGDGDTDAKARLWGHYTAAGGDIDAYSGSAGGNNGYSGAEWTFLEKTWTFEGDDGNNDGLVIEARIYAYSGGSYTAWIDDLNVSVNDADGSGGIEIHFAPIPAPGALALLGIAGIASRRRRR
jgi:MYXO-CTERM domain-containing protein